MLRIYAPNLVAQFINVAQAAGHFDIARTDDEAVAARAKFMPMLLSLAKVLDTVPMSKSLKDSYVRLTDAATGDKFTARDAHDVWTMSREFTTNAVTELEASYFLMILPGRRLFFEQPQPFGEEVAQRFANANKDIAAASRCFALDEWTACVFHLMRVLEIGLRDLARHLRVRIITNRGKVKPIDYAQWADILRPLSKAVENIGQAANTPAKKRRHEYYSRLAGDFSHFKDAWRNHVMHAREPYDERDADTVYTSVSRFMQSLAAGPPR